MGRPESVLCLCRLCGGPLRLLLVAQPEQLAMLLWTEQALEASRLCAAAQQPKFDLLH